MADISLHGTGKRFGAHSILKDINLNIDEGEFIVLVGPSGCGKSTLLRMISGLETPTGGDIRINGKTALGIHPKDRNLAMVFQSYALYPHMTVFDNMALGLKIKKVAPQQIQQDVMAVARTLNIEGLLYRKPASLSGGQRQRVAMGRAIVRRPAAFLFDEPLSNLDASLRLKMRTEIKKLHQKLRTTTIYVTHDQTEAMTLADRMVVLHQGHIQQVGPPMEVYHRPANKFVAGFVGSPPMNFISCRKQGTCWTWSNDDPLDPQMPVPQMDGDYILGVRPEHVVAGSQFAAGISLGHGVLEVMEPLGAEVLLDFRFKEQGFKVKMPWSSDFKLGDSYPLYIRQEDDIHLFRSADGMRYAN